MASSRSGGSQCIAYSSLPSDFSWHQPVTVGQTASTDSQTPQALLGEVRQLRKDLQTTTVASQRVQILVYRAQLQESVVAGAQQRLDAVHSKLAEVRPGVAHFASEAERAEPNGTILRTPPNENRWKWCSPSRSGNWSRKKPLNKNGKRKKRRQFRNSGLSRQNSPRSRSSWIGWIKS
jgi:hypothetical protein